MKLKMTQFTLTKNWNKLGFAFFLVITVLAGFPTTFMLAQNQLCFKNESVEKIVQSIEKHLDVKFNFNHSNLPLDRYTFSCSGSETEILATVFSVLDRRIEQLDDAIFTIQPINYPKEKKVSPLTITVTIDSLRCTIHSNSLYNNC